MRVSLPSPKAVGLGLLTAGSLAAAQTTSSSSSAAVSTTLATSTTSAATTSTYVSEYQTPTACATGLQLFVVRGSTEPAGVGRIGVVAGNISLALPGTAITAIDYPATYLDYMGSVASGVTRLGALVVDYAAKCPNGKIALLGYSQGAQVVGDMVCGTSERGFTNTTDLTSQYDSHIVAIVLFGDPTRSANQTWNVGTVTTRDGLFPRRDNAACDPFGDQLRSWCDAGDRYCDLGNQTAVHGSYFANYTDDATDFVVSKFNAAQATATTTSSPTGSTTPTPTSSKGAGAAVKPAGAFAAGAFGLMYLLL